LSKLPPAILQFYRIATAKVVRSWSFGALKAVRPGNAASWKDTRGSLDDQAIFGPIHSFVCACGKYGGEQYTNMVCDRCGVKVASPEVRRSRFAHVELAVSVPHPLGLADESVETWPILPGALVDSARGAALAVVYENLVRTNGTENVADIADAVRQVCDLLVPVFVQALGWNLREADTLARGLGLVCRTGTVTDDDRCEACGYPLGGVRTATCPGCEERIDGA
jgi:hypothetical protein